MNRKIHTTSRFSPGNCDPEFLESIHVGRRQLMDRMEKTVVESVDTGDDHHWLLVGPRGVGKSHLLSILFNRIDKNHEIRKRVVIAYMKEQEHGVSSFLDWLVRVLRALERRNENPDPNEEGLDLKEELRRLTETPPDLSLKAAERLLLRFTGDRRLLLIVENLDEIFSKKKGMGREGQQRFRDLVQQHPFWTIVASSRALFEDIQTRNSPFYGFFRIRHLPMLTFEESLELMENLAEADGRERLKILLGTPAGRGRMRAVHEITGGAPRLLVIFHRFLTNDSLEDITTPFMEMIDSLTPYYQERMQRLSSLQQKIVELLCERRAPLTVKEIAQLCFITHQTASTQLKRLIQTGIVQQTRVGRQSYYELRNPLFRICFELKENMGYSIHLFMEFLEKFHSAEELKKESKQFRNSSGDAYRMKGQYEEAIKNYRRAIELEPNLCSAHFNISLTWLQAGDLERGLREMERALEIGRGRSWSEPVIVCVDDINAHLLANAPVHQLPDIIGRQRQLFKEGAFSESFDDGLTGALLELLARRRDVSLERLNKLNRKVIPKLSGDEPVRVACRLFDTGVRYLQTGDIRVLLELPLEERSLLRKLIGHDGSTGR